MLGYIHYCDGQNILHTEHQVFDEDGMSAIFDFIDSAMNNGSFPYDGIFCNTDYTAAQIIKYLRNKNIMIPDDVQVIGYDGVKSYGFDEYYCSTIKQPIKEMAEAAVDILIKKTRDSAPSLVCLPVTYCYGGTTLK